MRLVIGLLLLAVVTTVGVSISIAVWDGRIGHHNDSVRTIHYDTNYDVSSQRRMQAE